MVSQQTVTIEAKSMASMCTIQPHIEEPSYGMRLVSEQMTNTSAFTVLQIMVDCREIPRNHVSNPRPRLGDDAGDRPPSAVACAYTRCIDARLNGNTQDRRSVPHS